MILAQGQHNGIYFEHLTPLAMVYAIRLFTIVLGNMTHVHFINFTLAWHGPDNVAPSDHRTHE